jgi:uncharacterized repeat protein (TIGR01451 family)
MRPRLARLALGLLGLAPGCPGVTPAAAQAPSSDLAIVGLMASPNPVVAGTMVVLTFTVVNNGPDPAPGVIITDWFPSSGFTVTSAAASRGECRLDGIVVTCFPGTMAPGDSVAVTVEIATMSIGTAENVATVDSPGRADFDRRNNEARVAVTAAQTQNDPAFVRALLGQFVSQFYTVVLDREPAASEVTAWVDFLFASPQNAAFIVQGFFNSLEFLHTRSGRVADYIELLYATVLGRLPAPAETAAWEPIVIGQVNAIIPGFVNSVEFQDLLRRTPPSDIVIRLYREVLGREPAPLEVADWLAILQGTGDWVGLSLGFLNSREYLDGSRTFGEHVVILYRTFLDRSPAPAEVDAWLGILGNLLVPIQNGFVNSPEFQSLLGQILGEAGT